MFREVIEKSSQKSRILTVCVLKLQIKTTKVDTKEIMTENTDIKAIKAQVAPLSGASKFVGREHGRVEQEIEEKFLSLSRGIRPSSPTSVQHTHGPSSAFTSGLDGKRSDFSDKGKSLRSVFDGSICTHDIMTNLEGHGVCSFLIFALL